MNASASRRTGSSLPTDKLKMLDRLLPLWILLAMAAGMLLGRFVPDMSRVLGASHIGSTSLPLALGLLLMMYPPLAKVRYDKLRHVVHDRRLLAISLVLNWVVGPALMFAVAWLLMPDLPEYRTGLIIVGLARCIAMVLIWNDLACGDHDAATVLVAINAIFQIVAYAALGWFYLQVLPAWLGLPTTAAQFSITAIAASVLIFLGVPLFAGWTGRVIGEHLRGREWYESRFLPRVGPLATWGLLYTVLMLFTFQGEAISQNPLDVIRIAAPLLIYFAVMFTAGFAAAVLCTSDIRRPLLSPSPAPATTSNSRSRSASGRSAPTPDRHWRARSDLSSRSQLSWASSTSPSGYTVRHRPPSSADRNLVHLLIIGGSDAGISAGLRAHELDPDIRTTLVVADRYPNYSICGLPYHISGEVADWHRLAHRTQADLAAAGLNLRLNTAATSINPNAHTVTTRTSDGATARLGYDRLVVATGASPATTGIRGLSGPGRLVAADGVHVMHTMTDLFDLEHQLEIRRPRTAIIVGAGYVGLEMAEALTRRGLDVTMLQRGPEVLPTLDPDLAHIIHHELERHGVRILTDTSVYAVERSAQGPRTSGIHAGAPFEWTADLVLAVVGVQHNTDLLATAGARLGPGHAILVDDHLRTGLPDVYAAGDGVTTRHRLLGTTYLPLGTTAHKQGRVAGANAVGFDTVFSGVIGTQVVKVFTLVAACTGLRDHDATASGHSLRSATITADDHKAYYQTARPITIRLTADVATEHLAGAQLVGSFGSEIAKRTDVLATAIYAGLTISEISDLDLSYTPPVAAPWDAIQQAAQFWEAETHRT